LLVIALAAAATWMWIARRPNAVPQADPADALDPQAAFVYGGRLGTAGRHTESIPYFRRAVIGMGGMWEGRFNLAAALINAALEVQTRLGRPDPALRSSYERVHSVFDGMAEARQAAQLARNARMRAYTAYQDAVMLQFWGMPWDALMTARSAERLDPGWDLPKKLANDLQRDLARGGITP
jgi:hypothetical protein